MLGLFLASTQANAQPAVGGFPRNALFQEEKKPEDKGPAVPAAGPVGGPAAGPEKKEPGGRVVFLLPNQTKQVEMTPRAGEKELPVIAKVQIQYPRIARVQSIEGDPTRVLVTGLMVGATRLTFIDINKNTEELEIRVTSEEEPIREAQRQELQRKIRQYAPTAIVDVYAEPNNLIILRGFVFSAGSLNVIQELTKSYFPNANILNEVIHGGVHQIQLEVIVAVVNRSELRQMSFNWIYNAPDNFIASVLASPLAFTNTITATAAGATANSTVGGGNLVFGISNNGNSFTSFLTALNNEGLANIMSIPTVVTQSGKPARFQSGGETPILTSTGFGSPTVLYRQFGTVVEFLPVILDKGKISLEVTAEISQVNQANGIVIAGGATVVPGFDVRRTQSSVTLEDGQTLAIGGLIQTIHQATNTKVPVLGDVPFLSVLFTNKSSNWREEEMLILVTPRLVDPLACTEVPKLLPGRETRRADDFELFLEGVMEAPRGQRNVCGPDRPIYQAPYHHSPSVSQFPCNDQTVKQITGERLPARRGAVGYPADGKCLSGRDLGTAPAPAPTGNFEAPLPKMPPADAVLPSNSLPMPPAPPAAPVVPGSGLSGAEVTPPLRINAPSAGTGASSREASPINFGPPE
jgi:pilus assembly protein CpaC